MEFSGLTAEVKAKCCVKLVTGMYFYREIEGAHAVPVSFTPVAHCGRLLHHLDTVHSGNSE